MDWSAIAALVALASLVSAGLASYGTHAYKRGRIDTTTAGTSKSAEVLANLAITKLDAILAQFLAHQLEDARLFAKLEAQVGETSRAQANADTRLAKALDDFGAALDRMTGRIDRVLAERPLT
ncbi:MAG: hypothetical protein ABSA68_13335 [Xanthobacteraceae bacterium]|jgi:hypothetical protein